ncbi:MAG: Glutamate-1-semialdehyde 2,1-aminomutase [Candidatus Bathyarchaeota archaeon BA1]|nr:MAG: Glutamate-1-semialdehyde 2,1-aminomutase [Candidatus Bathyarchaeota archaeon BA1]
MCDPAEVAALFVEPIQGESGYVVPPLGYLKELRKLCDKHGILLVCDEVQTGMGRTGKMFACEHEGVMPDIVCLAKALGAGLSIGATVAKAELADWEPGAHSNSFGGNPVMCAASLASIEVLVKERLPQKATKIGESTLKRLAEMKDRHKIMGDVRGKGLMIGVEFVKDKKTKERFLDVTDIMVEAHKRGLILLPCGVNCIRVVPPLIVTQEQMEKGLDILEQSISEVEKLL